MDSPRLVRALGRWDLAAIGINQVIGSAVFLMPSQVAAQVGTWAPLAFVLAGLASLLVALCFAESASRFDATGGAYLFTRTAFGGFTGFEVGWMAWFTRASSQAAVTAGLTLALGFYFPTLAAGWGRVAVVTVVTLGVAFVTYRGIRQSARAVNLFTVAKLAALAVFLVAGLWRADLSRLLPLPDVSTGQAAAAALLLIYVYGGFEVIAVPAGESADPRRDVPAAFLVTMGTVTALFTLSQVVATATLADLPASKTPLADSALVSLGPAGALLISVGSILSMTGHVTGSTFTGSRYLFALGECGDLPAWFARLHPRHQTPANAIAFNTAVTLGLALSGSFTVLASAAAIARLLVYAGTCASTLAFRTPRLQARVRPAAFTVPLGAVVPLLGMVVSIAPIAGATREQLLGGAAFLLLGAVLYIVAHRPAPQAGQRQD